MIEVTPTAYRLILRGALLLLLAERADALLMYAPNPATRCHRPFARDVRTVAEQCPHECGCQSIIDRCKHKARSARKGPDDGMWGELGPTFREDERLVHVEHTQSHVWCICPLDVYTCRAVLRRSR